MTRLYDPNRVWDVNETTGGDAQPIQTPRSPRVIAREIRRTWANVSPYARPYLDAMGYLESISDDYICDSGVSIVLYFLSNAASWRGPDAKRIKAELKALVKTAK